MKKKVVLILIFLFVFSTTVWASVLMSGGRVGWNRLNIGTLYNNLAGQFCDVFSGKQEGWWKSGSGVVLAENGLYIKCRQNFVLPTSVVMPTPTPTLAPSSALYDIPVLVLKYFPPSGNDSSLIDAVEANMPQGTKISDLSERINNHNNQLVDALTKGSSFHGYKDSGASPVLNYRILEEKEFLRPVPRSAGTGTVPADHIKILTGEGFNICDYVNNRGVMEVWLWMYHSNSVYPVESYQKGPYGGLGNGYMNLPLCNKTYTVYDYAYTSGFGNALEDHTHHIEHVLEPVDFYKWWRDFTGGFYEDPKEWQCSSLNPVCANIDGTRFQRSQNQSSPLHCGWTHCPPNVIVGDCKSGTQLFENGNKCVCEGYNWYSETKVLSDCEDWKPDGSGVKKEVNCLTWKDAYIDPDRYQVAGRLCPEDGGAAFKVWWMQNIPSSWWVWIGDFDGAKQRNTGLN